jgi:hypothetical protein
METGFSCRKRTQGGDANFTNSSEFKCAAGAVERFSEVISHKAGRFLLATFRSCVSAEAVRSAALPILKPLSGIGPE